MGGKGEKLSVKRPSSKGGDRPPEYPSRNFRSGRFPLLLLLLALSTLFLCNVDKGYLYRRGFHDFNTLMNLAMAENLSADHNFRLFRWLRPGPDGVPTYEMYSRFPVGGYALIKLAILPFGNDLSARILAARMLMLLLFSAAALLAFHSLARITSRHWVALAATLMAFSSYYMLFHGDAVCVEYSVDLFAVLLAFHGMVVFVQEGRFRQLLAKTLVALLLGWHVYAFLLPFILLGLGSEAVRAWKDGTAVWLRSTGAAVLRSRYTALGLAALLFGATVLGFNFANEYTAFEGQKPVTELPLFDSILRRTGLNRDSASTGWWLHFLRGQFTRVRVASVPLALTHWGAGLRGWFPSVPLSGSGLSGPELSLYLLSLLLAVAAAAVVVRLARRLLPRRRRMPFAVLGLSGFFWALPMRHNVVDLGHDHEALYYVGVPLVLYSLLLLYVHQRWGQAPVVGLAVAALLAFVVSAFQMYQRWIPDARAAEVQRTAMSELGAIRETTRGKVVLVLDSVEPGWLTQVTRPRHAWSYYLAGSIPIYPRDVEAGARAADFIVTPDRVESGALLTPGNERVFLYGPAGIDDLVESYRAAYRQVVSSGDPVARSHFDVYLGDEALTFVREPCVREDVRNEILLRAVPEDLKDLPGWRRLQFGSDHLVFESIRFPKLFEEKCMAVLPLPDYPVSRIRAAQKRHPSRIEVGQALHRSRDKLYRQGWNVEIPAGG